MNRLEAIKNAVVAYFTSFSHKNIKDGLIVGLGTGILLGCLVLPSEWDALEYYGIGPNIALVIYVGLSSTTSGMAVAATLVLLIGIAMTAVGYCFALYTTAAAIPGFAPGVPKAVMMICMTSILVFLVHLLRMRVPVFNLPGQVTQLVVTSFLFGSYFDTRVGLSKGFIESMLLYTAMGVGIAFLLTWLFIPSPTGKLARGVYALLLLKVGEVAKKVSALLKSPMDPESGRWEGAEDGTYRGVCKGLEAQTVELCNIDQAVTGLSYATSSLNALSKLEINLFSRPHIHPTAEYSKLLRTTVMLENLMHAMGGYVQRGSSPVRAVHAMTPQFDEFLSSVAECCQAMAGVVAQGAPYSPCINKVKRVEAACRTLFQVMQDDGHECNAGATWDESLLVYRMCNLAVIAGAETRSLVLRLPAAIQSTQPDAVALAEEHFSKTKVWWLHPSYKIEQEQEHKEQEEGGKGGEMRNVAEERHVAWRADRLRRIAEDALKSVKEGEGEVVHIEKGSVQQKEGVPGGISVFGAQPDTRGSGVILAVPQASKLRILLFRCAERTGLHTWHMALATQMTVVFIIAAIFNVNSTVNNALGGLSVWVMISTFVVSTGTTAGKIIGNCLQRIMGSAIGCAFSAFTIVISYAINGDSYDYTAATIITRSVLVAIYSFAVTAQAGKVAPRWQMMWKQAILTPPLVLVVQPSNDPTYDLLKWRLANISIGILIWTIISITVFPVTTRSHVINMTAQALQELTDVVAAVFDEVEEDDSLFSQNGAPDAAPNEAAAAAAAIPTEEDKAGVADRLAEAAQAAKQQVMVEKTRKLFETLDKISMLQREDEMEHTRLFKFIMYVGTPFYGKYDPVGEHRLEVLYQIRSILTTLIMSLTVKRYYVELGVWKLNDEWRKVTHAFGRQLEESLKGLRLAVLRLTPYTDTAETMLPALNSVKASMIALMAADQASGIEPSAAFSLGTTGTTIVVAHLQRSVEILYPTCAETFTLVKGGSDTCTEEAAEAAVAEKSSTSKDQPIEKKDE